MFTIIAIIPATIQQQQNTVAFDAAFMPMIEDDGLVGGISS